MKSIEEVQRFKQDKCALLLQTAECCDINEMIEQLKSHEAKSNYINSFKEKKLLIQKFNRNYAADKATIPNNNNNNQTSSTYNNNNNNSNNPLNSNLKAMGAGYKVYPKYVQNIETMGFEKPNWKPLMLNEKSSNNNNNKLENNFNITNSMQSFTSSNTKITGTVYSYNQNNVMPIRRSIRFGQNKSEKLESYLNSDAHKQKMFDLNYQKFEQRSLNSFKPGTLISSSTDNLTSNQLKAAKRPRKMFMSSQNLQSKTSQQQKNRPNMNSELSNYTDETLTTSITTDTSISNELSVNLPPLKIHSKLLTAHGENLVPEALNASFIGVSAHYSKSGAVNSSEYVNASSNRFVNMSKLSFTESEKLNETMSVTKICPSGKYKLLNSTELDNYEKISDDNNNEKNSSDNSNNKENETDDSKIAYYGSIKLDQNISDINSSGNNNENKNTSENASVNFDSGVTDQKKSKFLDSLLKQKNELDEYVAKFRVQAEPTIINYAPPNTPHYSLKPSTPTIVKIKNHSKQVKHVSIAIPDSKKYPLNVTNSNNLEMRARKTPNFSLDNISNQQNKVSSTDSLNSPIKPLIKSTNINNKEAARSKLERNLNKKIGESSMNMIKMHNKNVVLSNLQNTTIIHANNNGDHSNPHAILNSARSRVPIVSSINDKVHIDIYIPTGV